MYFSEAFGIDNPDEHDWFDPILEVDTRLFVDPFLVYLDEDSRWERSHDKMMDYFQDAFNTLASSNFNSRSQSYKRALAMMVFPEVKEVRLGFSLHSTDGAGSGKHLARLVIEAMGEAIKRGISDIRHFEELGILVEGINRDRISDITCTLLKSDLIAYTQDVCKGLDIPLRPCSVLHSKYDPRRQRWIEAQHMLPVDPGTGKAVILVPKRFLRELPSINANDWFEDDVQLRNDLNLEISRRVNKADIVSIARSNSESFQAWVRDVEERGAHPYDVDRDPKLLVKWQKVARMAALEEPLGDYEVRDNEESLLYFAKHCVSRFRHWVENKGGWQLFWEDQEESKPIPEVSMQLIFSGVLGDYCKIAGVVLDREVETGRGPVDFTFTVNSSVRVLLEMKKLTSGKFWHGMERQTPIYMKSQEVRKGILLAIRDSDTRPMRDRWRKLRAEVDGVSRINNVDIEIELVDALPKPSASKADE